MNTACPNVVVEDECIESARRIGKVTNGSSRMMLVKFKNFKDKLALFKGRPALRLKGVRISNELTFTQRKELKRLKELGVMTYYKNGQLCRIENKDNTGDRTNNTRVLKRAIRHNQTDLAENMEVIGDELNSQNNIIDE